MWKFSENDASQPSDIILSIRFSPRPTALVRVLRQALPLPIEPLRAPHPASVDASALRMPVLPEKLSPEGQPQEAHAAAREVARGAGAGVETLLLPRPRKAVEERAAADHPTSSVQLPDCVDLSHFLRLPSFNPILEHGVFVSGYTTFEGSSTDLRALSFGFSAYWCF